MIVHTGTIRYRGNDRLDTTVKSGDRAFAPTWDMVMGLKRGRLSWQQYVEQYTALMRHSWKRHNKRWREVLSMDEVVLCCYCRDVNACHRGLLAEMLVACGKSLGVDVAYRGER